MDAIDDNAVVCCVSPQLLNALVGCEVMASRPHPGIPYGVGDNTNVGFMPGLELGISVKPVFVLVVRGSQVSAALAYHLPVFVYQYRDVSALDGEDETILFYLWHGSVPTAGYGVT